MKKPKPTKRKNPKRVAAGLKSWETRRRRAAEKEANRRAEYFLVNVMQKSRMSAKEAALANVELDLAVLQPSGDYRWTRLEGRQ